MKLKVCGMKYTENIKQVAKLQPDYLGFIFYEKSPRYFKLKTLPKLPKNIKKTGVFINSTLDYILKQVEKHQLNVIQLHGNETPEFCYLLKTNLKNKSEIIKAFSIDNAFNFNILKHYQHIIDYFLFDTKGQFPGGNGYSFNWNILKKYPYTTPFFLSGGIGLNQINTIESFLKTPIAKQCYALDINSKFESKPGLKQVSKIKTFVNLINNL